MVRQASHVLEAQEAMRRALDAIAILPLGDSSFFSADVPHNARMIIREGIHVADEQTIEFWKPRASTPATLIPVYRPVGRPASTVAVLTHGLLSPVLIAAGGYSPRTYHRHQLDAAASILKIRNMCAQIGHHIAPNICGSHDDPAYHAEKRLLAYLHANRSTLRCKHVRIHLNIEPCGDCDGCLRRFVAATGISVTVLVHGDFDGAVSARALPRPVKVRYLKSGQVLRTEGEGERWLV